MIKDLTQLPEDKKKIFCTNFYELLMNFDYERAVYCEEMLPVIQVLLNSIPKKSKKAIISLCLKSREKFWAKKKRTKGYFSFKVALGLRALRHPRRCKYLKQFIK